ncbi:MAG TPA: hypothetical protein VMT16_14790 [Thermoanaerobaculia bacterium]|nr:hypothetical protein [Thermoanaerobaculia bacterium]
MDFDASMLVIIAIFGIAWVILKIFFFNPLLRVITSRESRIAGAREVWEKATAEAEEQLAGERQKLIAARRQAATHRETLRREAQERRRQMLEEAKAEAQRELERVRAELAAQVEEERRALEPRAARLADQIAERLLGRAV